MQKNKEEYNVKKPNLNNPLTDILINLIINKQSPKRLVKTVIKPEFKLTESL